MDNTLITSKKMFTTKRRFKVKAGMTTDYLVNHLRIIQQIQIILQCSCKKAVSLFLKIKISSNMITSRNWIQILTNLIVYLFKSKTKLKNFRK